MFPWYVYEFLTGRWFSHVGIIGIHNDLPYLFESTTLNKYPCEILGVPIKGSQAHDPGRRVKEYKGRVYLYRHNNGIDSAALSKSLIEKLGRPYDYKQAAMAGSFLRGAEWNFEDVSSLFCSEWVRWELEKRGVLEDRNASRWHPVGLINHIRRIGAYREVGRIH